MYISAQVSGLRGFTDSVGKQYVSRLCGETPVCEITGLSLLRQGNIGRDQGVLRQV
ncbi:MAG: hypothetical protein IKT67_08395 [Lachnospiraceae bacterium]|nr:hypothetical protein [Lachnospiraceae bacterium]